MKSHIGTSGFAIKEWKGKFYPEKISSKEMLSFYSQRLNTVEINNTFYHMPRQQVLASWAEQVPEDFIFAFKSPQIITHIKQMRNVAGEADYLFKTLSSLKKKSGPVLFQFPKSFPANKPVLESFLRVIPDGMLCAFEFRNSSWLAEETLDLLRKKGASLCIANTEENPANKIISTANWGYLRLRRAHYAADALLEWKDRITAQKWEEVFVYFKHEDEASGPRFAMQLQKFFDTDVKRGRKKEAA